MSDIGVARQSDLQSRKAIYVEAMFTRIARWYDLLNTVLSLGLHHGWRRRAVDLCNLKPGDRALDVCTGTGDFLFALGRAVGTDGQVVGVDFSPGMLAICREKLRGGIGAAMGLGLGDAERLPFPDGAFDAATVGFAGRNVTHLDRLFGEMARTVRPGGRVVFLELSRPRAWGLRHLYRFYFWKVAPIVGAVLSGDGSAYAYLPSSLSAFPGVEEVAQVMRGVGLEAVHYEPLAGGIVTIHVGTVTDAFPRPMEYNPALGG